MAPLPCIGMGLKWRIEGELQSGPRTGQAQRDERKDKRPVRIQFLQAFAVRMSGCPDKFLVPTARLELAQLSPLPPQDSVSTNFTTSADFIQKSRGFLESRTFYHVIDDSRASARLAAPDPAVRRASPGQQALTSATGHGINLSCLRAILASPCAHPGCSRGISSGYSYKREFVGAHAWPAYDASHTQQGLRPVEKVPPCNV